MNCGKQSMVLDLQTADGKRMARELAQRPTSWSRTSAPV